MVNQYPQVPGQPGRGNQQEERRDDMRDDKQDRRDDMRDDKQDRRDDMRDKKN